MNRRRHGFGLERFGLYFRSIGETGRVELHPIDLAAGVVPASLHPPLQIERVELFQQRRHPIHHAAGTIPVGNLISEEFAMIQCGSFSHLHLSSFLDINL
ncbi:unnamed protein product [Urochloa humidicola]